MESHKNNKEFWEIIRKSYTENLLNLNFFSVEYQESINVTDNENKQVGLHFSGSKKLLFVNFNYIYEIYAMNKDVPIAKNELQKMLKNDATYIGVMKARKFNDKSQRCMVFYINDQEIDITCMASNGLSPKRKSMINFIFDKHADCHAIISGEKAITKKKFTEIINKFFNH
jgi:hypothetical protein